MLALTVLLASGCSASAPDDDERHRMATSAAADRQRAGAERAIRKKVAAFAARTSLEPGFLRLIDTCDGPRLPDLFDETEDPVVVHCYMYATAYYGAPRGITPTLKEIDRAHLGDWGGLTGGDPDAGGVGGLPYALEYQRDKGRQADGLRLSRPQLNDPSFTVEWDDPWDPGWRVGEPLACPPRGPDVRCLTEPAGATVTGVRARHRTVFSVGFDRREYWTVSRKDWQDGRG
ncbi:hypothetical protein S1361_28260 [Streptomyces cyanogenus]|uniref:Lipoprotein n=1 Tax=Streptomyces cyanogenus TaxID=80860 RepID=A0ABX7TWX1_STRCY|nr:hypothetical protein S1361_28260 [Streptomyces cyanogenus]